MGQLRTVAVCLSMASLGTFAVPAGAQSLLKLPEASQRSVVMQRIGLTDITVTYHRPLVNGRKVWGALVPYDQVWRAGANENTTIQFSDPVIVEGQPLAKGTYGLHMIPGTDSWTVIFSNANTAWGSFSYKQDEDALRVTVKPQPAEMHEALAYDFDDLKPESARVTLRWEKVAVPFKVAVNEADVTLSSLRKELRSGKQYTWISWDEAASYALAKKTALDDGLKWAERSIVAEERFENVMTKSRLLDAMNRKDEAKTQYDKAMQIGNVLQIYSLGRQMQLQENNQSGAIEIFRITAKRFPEHWVGHLAQARVASAAGDFDGAIKEIKTAQQIGVAEPSKQAIANLLKKLEAKQDINR